MSDAIEFRTVRIDLDSLSEAWWPKQWRANFEVAECVQWARRSDPRVVVWEWQWLRAENHVGMMRESPLVFVQIVMVKSMMGRLLKGMYDSGAEECRRPPVCGLLMANRVTVREGGPFIVRPCTIELAGPSDKLCTIHGLETGQLQKIFDQSQDETTCSFALAKENGVFTCPIVEISMLACSVCQRAHNI